MIAIDELLTIKEASEWATKHNEQYRANFGEVPFGDITKDLLYDILADYSVSNVKVIELNDGKK